MNRTGRRALCALALAGALLVATALPASPARADSIAKEGGLGLASFFSSLVYGAGKLVWATTGLLGSGLGYALTGGDRDVAISILNASIRGDYVLTPRHLTGKEEIEFIGRSPENREARKSYPSW
jgi:hypothetical protein